MWSTDEVGSNTKREKRGLEGRGRGGLPGTNLVDRLYRVGKVCRVCPHVYRVKSARGEPGEPSPALLVLRGVSRFFTRLHTDLRMTERYNSPRTRGGETVPPQVSGGLREKGAGEQKESRGREERGEVGEDGSGLLTRSYSLILFSFSPLPPFLFPFGLFFFSFLLRGKRGKTRAPSFIIVPCLAWCLLRALLVQACRLRSRSRGGIVGT